MSRIDTSKDAYFEGAHYDYFVKPVILGNGADGEMPRWAAPEDGKPDAWTVYQMPRLLPLRAIIRDAVEDHLDRNTAIARAQQLALEDKALALLKG